MQKITIPVHESFFLSRDFHKRPDKVYQVYFQQALMWTKKEIILAALAIVILLVAATTAILCLVALVSQNSSGSEILDPDLETDPLSKYSKSDPGETTFLTPSRVSRHVLKPSPTL